MIVQINEILETVCWLIFIYTAVKLIKNLKIFNAFVEGIQEKNNKESEEERCISDYTPSPEFLDFIKSVTGADFVEIKSVSRDRKPTTLLEVLENKLKHHEENEEFEEAAKIKNKIDNLKNQQK